MTIGAPIDSSIRRLVIDPPSINPPLSDSSTDLDSSPQLIMTPGSEQFAFQFPDKLGDGREEKYEGYNDAGGGSSDPASGSLTILDFITALIIKPVDRVYIVGYDVPFPVEILSTSFVFGTGPGSAAFSSGTVDTGNNIEITISGTDGTSADFSATIDTRVNQ